METLNVKPISLNHAYRGRRFRTPELEAFKIEMNVKLPRMEIPDGKLAVTFAFGVSSKASDLDNLVKATQDAIADKYGFDDRRIYALSASKSDVPKGEEYIMFEISGIKT